jgi:lycopene beta-cyclase
LPLPYGRADYGGTANQRIGYAGGWFHPGTGYSLPVAVRLAHVLATAGRDSKAWHAFARNHRAQAAFCRRLNGLLFRGYEPAHRRNIFERFYKLDSETIRRFYALEMTRADRLRILFGGPPRGFSFRRYFTSTK